MSDTQNDNPPAGFRLRQTQGAFTRLAGPFYLREGEDSVSQGLRVREKHCNRSAVVHGGVIATLADGVLGWMISRRIGEPAFTISMEVQFLAPAQEGDWLEAEARISHQTGRLFFCDVVIHRHRPGEKEEEPALVSQARAIFSRRPKSRV